MQDLHKIGPEDHKLRIYPVWHRNDLVFIVDAQEVVWFPSKSDAAARRSTSSLVYLHIFINGHDFMFRYIRWTYCY